MPNEKADDKKTEAARGEQAEKSTDQSAEDEGRRKEKKRPEPSGNLKRRSGWFQKRH